MNKANDKNQRLGEYGDVSYEDVRTIPDFYDNLYPSADRPETGFPIPAESKIKREKKCKKMRKRKKRPADF